MRTYSVYNQSRILLSYFISGIIVLSLTPDITLAQLSGTYTIGESGNYTSFTSAVNALESEGVSGPLTFEVQDGLYEEQIEINTIAGTSEVNMITFQSASQDSSKVILKHAASSRDDNFVIKLNGASYITFNQINIKTNNQGYGTAVRFENSAACKPSAIILPCVHHFDMIQKPSRLHPPE